MYEEDLEKLEADLEKHDYKTYYFDEDCGDYIYNDCRDDEEDYYNQTVSITRR